VKRVPIKTLKKNFKRKRGVGGELTWGVTQSYTALWSKLAPRFLGRYKDPLRILSRRSEKGRL